MQVLFNLFTNIGLGHVKAKFFLYTFISDFFLLLSCFLIILYNSIVNKSFIEIFFSTTD